MSEDEPKPELIIVQEHGRQMSSNAGTEKPGSDADLEVERTEDDGTLVEEPAKVMRIGTMIKQLLDEVKAAPLDERSRVRLAEIYETSVEEISEGLAPELAEELSRLASPFEKGETPSDAELRIAQAQLVGWLEGLFHGIQASLFAQQAAARAQLQDMQQRQLPSGRSGASSQGRGKQNGGDGDDSGRPGTYL